MTERGRRWIQAVLPVILAMACSADPKTLPARAAADAAPGSSSAPQGTPASAPAPAGQDCGPAIEGQADQLRAAVLKHLIRMALENAAAAGTTPAAIVIGEEQRFPGGQVMLKDASPEVTALFANHTPPVGAYSSAFLQEGGKTVRKKDTMSVTTGDICWMSGGRAAVRARTVTETANRPYTVTVQRTGADWLVTSAEARR